MPSWCTCQPLSFCCSYVLCFGLAARRQPIARRLWIAESHPFASSRPLPLALHLLAYLLQVLSFWILSFFVQVDWPCELTVRMLESAKLARRSARSVLRPPLSFDVSLGALRTRPSPLFATNLLLVRIIEDKSSLFDNTFTCGSVDIIIISVKK